MHALEAMHNLKHTDIFYTLGAPNHACTRCMRANILNSKDQMEMFPQKKIIKKEKE